MQPIRIAASLAVSLVLILSPLAGDRLSNTAWLGLGAGMLWAVVLVETVGALPSAWGLRDGVCEGSGAG